MKRQKDQEVDVPFDVEPVTPENAPDPNTVPKDLLSASKVEAVRFHPAKPGYAYDQVETFVDAVTRTLRYLEQRMYQDDVALHEAEQENELLNDQIATLKATIEVFRANGDPVGAADGGFATASSIEDPALRAERDSLAAALAASQAEVAELRAYIDTELAPWIAEQEASANNAEPTESTEPEVAEAVEEQPVVQAVAEPQDLEVEEPVIDEKAVFAATAAAFAAEANETPAVASEQSDDWDDIEAEGGWDTPGQASSESGAEDSEVAASGLQFSTPEIEALGVEIDPAKVIRTDDSQYERATPPKAGTPLPRLLPPEIAAMMDLDDE